MEKKIRGPKKQRQIMGEEKWKEYQRKRKQLKVIEWRKRAKVRLINYKGGKCEICGYNKNVSCAYDFHHIDPKEKDFNITGKTISIEKLKNEVDKCLLLCANCHREIHQTEYDKQYKNHISKRKIELLSLRNT